jgi:tetratricopeptide (TPR) repeat protein
MLFILCLSGGVQAQSYADAEKAYIQGDYALAVQLGQALETADGYALAARANLVIAAYLEDDRDKALITLRKAVGDADQAIALNPQHIEGRLQKAIALGYQARITRSTSLARETRLLIDDVLTQDPQNDYALATLGGWHGESIATAGGFFARLATGARKSEFQDAFEAALKADPHNPATRSYYARLLLDIGGSKFKDRAVEVLEEAISIPPRNAFEVMMQTQAITLNEALKTGDKKALKELVKDFTPFN